MASINQRIAKLRQTASESAGLAGMLRGVAAGAATEHDRQLITFGAESADARSKEKAAAADSLAKRAETPVQQLDANAPQGEISEARRQSAVRVGEDCWLPFVSKLLVAIPNDVLRSALFGTGDAGKLVKDYNIACANQDVRLTYTGVLPGERERAMFVAALSYYNDQSLGTAVLLTFNAAAVRAGFALGSSARTTVDEALTILAGGALTVHGREGHKLTLPHLLRYGVTGDAKEPVVALKIDPEIALLYGREQWSALRLDTIHDQNGPRSWLATHYESHKTPVWLSLDYLARISRWTRPLPAFRFELRKQLASLKSAKTPENQRLAAVHYCVQNGKEYVWVCRATMQFVADAIQAAAKAKQPVKIQPEFGPDKVTPFEPKEAPAVIDGTARRERNDDCIPVDTQPLQ